MKKSQTPIIFVVLAFAVFPPLGLFLLYRYMTSDKTTLIKDSSLMRNIGVILTVFGSLGLGMQFIGTWLEYDPIAYNIICLVMVIGGVSALLISHRLRLKTKRFRMYMSVIANDKIYRISTIADVTRQNVETVTDDLMEMIEIGYFTGAYIDGISGSIVLPQPRYPLENTVYWPSPAPQAPVARVMKCKYCTANSVIYFNEIAQCEYCGASLE